MDLLRACDEMKCFIETAQKLIESWEADPDNYSKLDRLKAFAGNRSRSLNELAHAWLLAQPQISSVISGATSVKQVQANAAGGDWTLAKDEINEINAILGK